MSRSSSAAAASALSAACRAARPSSAARASSISTASLSDTRRTRRPPVALVLHEPIVLEADEGHSHGRPTQPELRAQIFLEQALARRQLSTDNRVAEILVAVGPE